MSALLVAAYNLGVQAVAYVVANAAWLIPMGSAAITLLQQLFG
jgi:hypothetical protein